MRFIKLIFHRSHRIYKKTPDNSGQAFLIVVLIMVIALTVGLSIASRTVTNLKMGSEEANSQKAFSAAEAGVEQYLQAGSTNPSLNGTSFNNGSQITNISRTYEGQGATSTLLNNGDPVSRDEGADIWLNKFDSNPANLYTTNWSGTFKVYWGDYTGPIAPPSTQFCSFAAVELIVITGPTNWRTNPTQLSMTRYPVENGCSSGRTRNFPLPNSAGVTNFNNAGVNSGINFLFANSFTVSNVLFARVIPLFANTKIGVSISSGSPFPSTGEGQLIISQGQAGSTQRQVTYFETWDSLPSAFLFSVLSSQ